MIRHGRIWLWAVAVALNTGGSAIAGEDSTGGDSFAEAKAALAELDRFWQTLDTARSTAIMRNAGSVGGKEFDDAQRLVLAFSRPNRFVAGPPNLGSLSTAVSDGESTYVYFPNLDGYLQSPAPERLTSETVGGAVGPSLTGSGPLLTAFLCEKPSEILLEGVVDGKVLGASTVDEVECRAIELSKPPFTYVLHLGAGEEPWPRRIEIDFSNIISDAMNVVPRDLRMGAAVDFEPWRTGEDVGVKFNFRAPEGAYAAGTFYELVSRVEPPHPLLNAKAPKFKLRNLDGKRVNLDDVLGRKAVLIDFWATYCAPCVTTLPFYAELKSEFGDDLAVYAVNLSQDAKTIREFLDEIKIDIPVLLDADADAARKYQIESIPQCFLIDTGGNIQAAHAGYADGFEEYLKGQIKVLVRGGAL